MMINLKNLRLAKGLTQQNIGDIVGVNGNTICQWEKGVREPDFQSLIKLATYFNVSTDYLLDRDEPLELSEKAIPIVKKISQIDPYLLTDLDEYIDYLIKKQK